MIRSSIVPGPAPVETPPASAADKLSADLRATGETAREAGRDLASDAGEVLASARSMLDEMRRIARDFAAQTSAKAAEAIDTVGTKGGETVDRVSAVAGDLRALGRENLDDLADVVAKRPVAALATAAGIGLLIGLVARSGPRG